MPETVDCLIGHSSRPRCLTGSRVILPFSTTNYAQVVDMCLLKVAFGSFEEEGLVFKLLKYCMCNCLV
jgi:hypothetical protein